MAYGGGELPAPLPEPDSARVATMLEAVKPRDAALPVARRLAMGAPAAEICRIAAEEGADMIVMGTHGRTGVMRLLMGSIAESVLRHAPCPVLVYRETARKPAAASVANG